MTEIGQGSGASPSTALGRRSFPHSDWDEQFEELYSENRPRLLAYAERRGARDPELVVDLALFDFYRAKERLRSDNSKVYWAYMYRAVDSHLARERRRPIPDPASEVEDLERIVSFEEQLVDQLNFDDALALLTPNQAEALRLQMVDGMTSVQAGDALGKSSTATRQLQHQALRRLRRLFFGLAIVIVIAGGLYVMLRTGESVSVEEAPVDAPVDSSPSPETGSDEEGLQTDGNGQTLRFDQVGPPSTSEQAAVQQSETQTLDTRPSDAQTSDTQISESEGTGDVPTGSPPGFVEGEVGLMLVNSGTRQCLDDGDPQSLIQWGCHGDPQQRFIQVADGDGAGFLLRLESTNRCLWVDGPTIRSAECGGGDGQLFEWDGARLRTNDGTCMMAAGTVSDLKTQVTSTTCDDSAAQRFVPVASLGEVLPRLREATSASHDWSPGPAASDLLIKNTASDLCLDLAGLDAPGLNQFECHGGENQRFHQVPLGDGFALQMVGTDLCLDAFSGDVSVMPCDSGSHQTFTWAGEQLQEQAAQRCLAVEGNSLVPRAQLTVGVCENTPGQRFVTVT